MRTSQLIGGPLALAGIALLLVAFDLNLMVNAPQTAEVAAGHVQVGTAQVPVATAVLIEGLFFVLGVATVIGGAVVRMFGRGPGA